MTSQIQSARIRRALTQGAATPRELAIELKMKLRNVQVGLWVLSKSNQVRVVGALRRGKSRHMKIYELTPVGRRMEQLS